MISFLKNLKAATSITIDDFNKSLYKYSGIYARVNYNLKDKYVLNATVRRDGSTRFGKGRQFGNFWFDWCRLYFHNEKIIRDFQILKFWKIRTSYGISGNDQIGNYGYSIYGRHTNMVMAEILGYIPKGFLILYIHGK